MSNEVLYKGCKFRSRLEARWAIFFDELDLDWMYLYPKNDNVYTPDFYLPQKKSYIEINEKIPSQYELYSYDEFIKDKLKQGETLRLLIGDIPRATSDFGAFKTIKQQIKKPHNQAELNQIRERIKGIQAFKYMPENGGVTVFGQWEQQPQLGTMLFKSVWVMKDYRKVDLALSRARKVKF